MNLKATLALPMSIACFMTAHAAENVEPLQMAAGDMQQTASADAIIVSATKVRTQLKKMTQPTTVVDAGEIEAKAHIDLTEVLRAQPSIEFKKAGGPGQFNYLRLRGFSNSILFVLDGVVMNDGNSGGIGNLIGQIDPSMIGSLEVLRGPHATVYGADTTAGVISLTTKGGESPESAVAVEGGSLKWKKIRANYRNNFDVGDGTLNFALNGSITDSGGVHQFEYFKDKSFSGKISYVKEVFEIGSSVYRTDNRFQYAELKEAYCCQTPETYWSFQVPDPNQNSQSEFLVGTIWAKHKISDRWSQKLQLSGMKRDYDTIDLDDGLLAYQPAPLKNFVYNGVTYAKGAPIPIFDRGYVSYTTGKNKQADYNLVYSENDLTALFGATYLQQKFLGRTATAITSDTKQSVKSVYGQIQFDVMNGKLHPNAGVRLDDYSAWGREVTYSVGSSFDIAASTSVYANYGTSFTQPTLSQLFNPTYGNGNLTPANGKTVEGGIRHKLFGGTASIDLAVYHSMIHNIIMFDSSIVNPRVAGTGRGLYVNRDAAMSQGVELAARYQILPDVSGNITYSYTDAETKAATGQWNRMFQVAYHKINFGLNYASDRVDLGANLYYVGPRLRWAGDISTDGYWRLDLSGRYRVTDWLSVYGRVQNALDANIIEEVGYKQPGLYAISGLEVKF